MKKLLLAVFINLAAAAALFAAGKWNSSKGTHFIVYFRNAPADFIEKLIDQAEDSYNSITEDLGFVRYDFWLWENRAQIYVFDDAEGYQQEMGQPAWSAAGVEPKEKVIYTFVGARDFLEAVLPHEIGHIVFREFVGFLNPGVPIWLDEGVASYAGKFRHGSARRFLKELATQGTLPGLKELSALNPQMMSDTAAVALFYAEAASVVDYLLTNFGRERFVSFCRNLRDKKDLAAALSSTYGFKDIAELDLDWQASLKK